MPESSASRVRLAVRGAVQGVGFRPFVFRLAEELRLNGWVNNSPQGVFIEAEGDRAGLEKFLLRLEREKPPRSFLQSLETTWLDPVGYDGFEIRSSGNSGGKTALVLPDIATCPDCLREMFDPMNRRYLYPFTNCTHCGPRFSIIESLPYDRVNTSMKQFAMCPACQREYDNPRDRRFHAQPNACPVCGPRLEFWNATGEAVFVKGEALMAAVDAIHRGRIVAVKGVGGFHLLADARNEQAVQLLRERKQREEKPFALLFPSLESVKAVCEVSPLEARLLCSPEAPIVLLRKLDRPHHELESRAGILPARDGEADALLALTRPPGRQDACPTLLGVRSGVTPSCLELAPSIAPGNPNLGVMLPSNPLHHLLMAKLQFPVVATSGNLSDEPICTDEFEALKRLRGIADVFLVHNRPIVRHVDDSIVRVVLNREMIIRRARGYAPLPISIGGTSYTSPQHQALAEIVPPEKILAVGAHLKNTVALALGGNVFISQHIGDLETEQANHAFRRVIDDFEKIYEAEPETVVADLHPDYLSTKYALERRAPPRQDSANIDRAWAMPGAPRMMQVQHHITHVLSCIAENEMELPALGVAWDGTGYGTDGTIWGGEFFRVTGDDVQRVASFRPFRLPGGDKAVKQPRRVALALLHELYGEAAFEMSHLPPLRETPPIEMITLKGMLQRRFNSPLTSSVGRLFDAVASLVNLRHQVRFEGQAAMELEFALDGINTDEAYEFQIAAREDARPTNSANPTNSSFVLDWSQMIHSILSDVAHGTALAHISAKFHNALAEAVVAIARRMGEPRVAISGGCFQNRYLLERTVTRLREENFQPYWHQRVPTNDGGIALGQIAAVRRKQPSSIANRKSQIVCV